MSGEETARDEAALRRSSEELRRDHEEERGRAEGFVTGMGERLMRLAGLRPFRFARRTYPALSDGPRPLELEDDLT